MVELGREPEVLVVNLTKDADFISGDITYKVAGVATDWPDGSEVELRFYDSTGVATTWTAEIDGSVATIVRDKALVNAALAQHFSRVKLFYVNDDLDECLAAGDEPQATQ